MTAPRSSKSPREIFPKWKMARNATRILSGAPKSWKQLERLLSGKRIHPKRFSAPSAAAVWLGWHLAHQKVTLASSPCLRDKIGYPQRRHGSPRRRYTHNPSSSFHPPVVRRIPP